MSSIKVIGNLSLRRFFLFANEFCDGYTVLQSSLGRVKLVARSTSADIEYQSKVYRNYQTLVSAMDMYITNKFEKL